ncbi:MAG TPA: tail fiber domain-containing protein [Longimicrobium sp.]|nr:tail fiber domain-containing protein [Longimicrobium sp.]
MKLIKRALLAAALLVVPATAQAQVDSALAVSSGGVSLFKVFVDGTISAFSSSTPLLRLRAGSPAGNRFVVDSAGGVVALGMLGIGIIPQTGAGERMMWHPYKGSFRAGGVSGSQWDDSSMGFYGAAFGYNTIGTGNYSFVSGYQSLAQASYSTAIGYTANANGTGAVAIGYRVTADANYSVAIGHRASANGFAGAIVFSDQSSTDSVEASANNQFSLRAAGGIRLYTNSTKTTGVTMNAGGSAWNVLSDRNRKENFLSIDGEDLLARLRNVPVTTWNYIAEGRQVRHIGPMAQDWHAAFGFNADPLTINQGDFDGVNLAAVKALDARTQVQAQTIEAQGRTIAAQQQTIDAQGRELAEVRARLERIEAALAAQGTAAKP